MFEDTRVIEIADAVKNGSVVGAIKICGFAGLLNYKVSPGRIFADELRGRVRVIACLDKPPVIFHSDEFLREGPSEEEWRRLNKALNSNDNDVAVIVWGKQDDVDMALSEIAERAMEAAAGVPGETRQVLKQGDTEFERILPGPDRMYPDTDSAPIPIEEDQIEEMKKHLPHTPDYWRKKYKELLHPALLDQIIDEEFAQILNEIYEKTGSEIADDKHIVLKMNNGYNIGILSKLIADIKETGYREAHYKIPGSGFPSDPKKPDVTLLGTGGTIASRLDYRTGAVILAFSPGELYGAVPELAEICNLKTEKLFGLFSENMGPEQWKKTAETIRREIKRGVNGIVIGHGADTMHHTSAILSFMVQNSPVPIVLVGSQRSSDRPSSDAAFNLRCAVFTSAYSDIAEVVICMFGPTSDKYNLQKIFVYFSKIWLFARTSVYLY